MSVGGVEEAADAVVSAALGRAQERQAAQLLAAGAHGGARRQGNPGNCRAAGRARWRGTRHALEQLAAHPLKSVELTNACNFCGGFVIVLTHSIV